VNTSLAFLISLDVATINDVLFFFTDSNPPTNLIDDSGDRVALCILAVVRYNVWDGNQVELDSSCTLWRKELFVCFVY